MYQVCRISENIETLCVVSLKQRLKFSTPNVFDSSSIENLNDELDNFYEFLYSHFNSITEDDYHKFGAQLEIMLEMIKELLKCIDNNGVKGHFKHSVDLLKKNYSALYELNSDIVNFKIKMPKDNNLKSLLETASNVTKNLAL